MKKLLLLSVATMLFSCGKKADFSKIKQGMPLKEVVELVGEPQKKQDNSMFGKWYIYETHIVVFTNDTVAKCTSMKEMQEGLKKFNDGMDKLNEDLKK